MIGWNFPSNNYGRDSGFNDAGIEHFRGDIWGSLAREIIQNSLDAKCEESDKPVEVHFEFRYLPRQQFPGRAEFAGILRACKEFWKINKKAKIFFNSALDVVKSPEIPVLVVRDFNTTGLSGSGGDFGSDWYDLVKSEGASNKRMGAGGSFGIGKNAPFACSKLRTVFYGTKDKTGKRALQGVANLVTHRNEVGEKTQGTGYYGIKHRNQPLHDYESSGGFFFRDKVGTDIFILGFNAAIGWENKIVDSILENFFVSINREKLIAKVGDILIDHHTLPELLKVQIENNETSKKNYSPEYYRSLVSPEKTFVEKDFEGLGALKLFLLSSKNYPKRVAMVRSTGMKIFDKGHFRTPLKFAGVFIAEGVGLNEVLRQMEPPSHNKWVAENYENDPVFARRILRKINEWLNEKIRTISAPDDSEELDIEGISQFLPDDLDDVPFSEDEDKSTKAEKATPVKTYTVGVEYKPVPVTIVSGLEAAASDNLDDTKGIGELIEGCSEKNQETKTTEQGKPRESKGVSAVGEGEIKGGFPDRKGRKPIRHRDSEILESARSFILSPSKGIYNLLFRSRFNCKGFIKLKAVGEVGMEKILIKSAVEKNTRKKIDIIDKDTLGPIDFKADKKQGLIVYLENASRCSLEVMAYGN
ncbi:MAG: hypothetical protein GX318_03760 [Clostridia bacterium]|nr:hypothetical protein [Clostridia bacterium]